MSMTRTCLISFAMLAIGVMGFQPPLATPTDPSGPGDDVAGRVNVGSQGGYFRLNHVVGNGVGWDDGGFTTLGGWLPFNEFGSDTLWYADMRIFVSNDSYVGQNTGLGVRQYNSDWDRFFGAAVFYDYDHGAQRNGFGQITTSLETIGNNWDARVNGYFPVANSTRNLYGMGESISPDPFFKNNRIFFPGTGVFLEALTGGDAEFGVPISQDAQWLRAYAGGYAYNSNSHKDIQGFRGRLEAQLSDDLSVQGQVTDDRTFGTLVNLIVDVRLGGGRPIRAFPNLTSRERMYLPVQRNWRISTNTYKAPINVVARDPGDHHKLEVAWVDSAADPGGDGTYEHPFQTLLGAEGVPAADFILVRHGNGSTYDGGITLKDNQRFLGEGIAHQFDAYASFGKAKLDGTYTLPGFTNDPSLTPTITNSAGHAVTLANNNEVSSFNIDAPTGVGIYGNGINDFNLNNLNIDNPGLGGIVLSNASGQGTINTSTIDGGFGPGVMISNVNTAPLNLDISNIGSVTGTTQALSIGADNSEIIANVDGFLASSNQAGLDVIASNGGIFNGQILNSTFDGSTAGDGMRLTAVNPNSILGLTTRQTTASNSAGNGLVLDSSDGATAVVDITDGDFSGAGQDGVRVLAANTSNANSLTMTNTDAASAGTDGLHAEITNNSLFTVDITNGSFAGAGQDAIDTTVTAGSTLNLTIDPTPATMAGANGFRFQVADSSTLNANIIDVDLSGATANGILGNVDTQSTVNLALIRSAAVGSGQAGMKITAANDSIFNAKIVDGDFSGSGENGIDLALSTGAQGTISGLAANSYANLSSAGNTLSGLRVDLKTGATLDAAFSNGSFSGNLVNAINATIDGTGSSATLNLSNIVATNSGVDGFIFGVQNGGNLDVTGTGGSFNNSGNHGIRGTIASGSSASLDFDGTTVANSQADGLYINGSGGSTFTGIFSNGSFANSGTNIGNLNRNAIEIAMDNSFGSLNLTNTAGNNSGQNGLLMSALNGSVLNATVVNGNFNNSLANAVQANVDGMGSSSTLAMTNTTGNNSGLDGIRFNVSNNAQFTATATGGSFNNSGDSGVRGVLSNSAQASVTFNNVAVDRSNDDGLFVSSTNNSTFTGNFTGGGFTNSGQDAGSLNRNAVELLVTNSTNTLNMTNTAGNNAGADGLHFEVNGGQLTGTILGGTFANAGSNAVQGMISGPGSSANVSLDGTSASNAGSDGVVLSALAGSNLDFSFANSSISNSGGNGVLLNADAAGTTASLTLNNANVDNNGVTGIVSADGLNLSATSGAAVDVNLTSGTINGNRNNGIRVSSTGFGSNINFNGNGTTVNGNLRGDGLGFTATGGGSVTGGFVGGSFSNNGTVVAANGVRGNVSGAGSVADLTFDGTAVDNNRADGFNMTAINGGALTLNLINGMSASNNTGYGINFLVDGPGTEGNLLMSGANIITDNDLGGILFTASNGAQTTSTIAGNVSDNGGVGVNIIGTNLTINSLSFSGIFDHNVGQGINVDLNNSTVNSLTVADATVTNNSAQGVRLAATNNSHINNGQITNNTITTNAGDGILFSLTNSDATLFSIDNNLAINTNTGNGVHVVLNNAPTSAFAITNNMGISGNTQNGVVFDLTNSALTDVLVDANAIQGNGAAGLQFNTTTSNVSGAITNNVIGGNTLSGIGIAATGGVAATSIDFGNVGLGHQISGNTINGNGNAGVGAGILANVGQNVNLNATIQDNTISQNQSFGVGITSTNGSVALTLGGATAGLGNTLDQNVGAGLALTLQNASTGTVDIQNNTITRTTNSNATFQGDGINIRLTSTNVNPSTAQLTASVISNNTIGDATNAALGNAGRGVVVTNSGNSVINDLTMDQNTISRNGGDGIQFNKLGDANLTNVSITNSDLNNNGDDGIDVTVANGAQTTTFAMANNNINNNVNRGIHLEVQADSKINADLTNNMISGNGSHGIQVTEQVSDPTDQRDVTGVWIQNQILNNGGNGISLNGAYGNTSPLIIGQTGFDGGGNSLGNTIDNNAGFGIASNAAGAANIANNVITNNQGGGVQIVNTLANSATVITLDQNLIASNVGDGLELRASGTSFLSITATGNSILDNTGRGVDSLNQVNATTFLQFGDGTIAGGNLISGNLGEGFYVVNTSSANQTQNVPSTTALLADGAVNVSPDMILDLQFNTITNNGSPGAFASSGLVLRVGTSNSGGNDLLGNGTAGVGNAGLVGNGRVNARVTDNAFGGNFGSDVLIESFTSTVNPNTSTGTWDAVNFTPTIQRDPLARLNMVFKGNTGDALDVTRTGASYSNDESTFKSRTNAQTPAGPFTSGTRRRNAQRVASGAAEFAAPGAPPAAIGFAYDGVGSSTFRIESDFSTAGFAGGDTFVGDLGPVPPAANAGGDPFTTPIVGELPFGWDTSVAVGTFQFLIP
ncbi:MAG: right-handed parallel beta-helix repeat-containing protein [Planctomycetota bacterium]